MRSLRSLSGSLRNKSGKGTLLSLYREERRREASASQGPLISLPELWEGDLSALKQGDRFEEDFLVLSIQPFDRFFNIISILPPMDLLDSKHQTNYDLGILLEHRSGFKILGIVKYTQFRIWKVIPEIGSRYRVTGFMERWLNGIKGDEFVCWGCRLEKFEY